MGKISNFAEHEGRLHSRLKEALSELNAGTAPHIRWDLLEGFRQPDGSILRIAESYRSWDDQDKIFSEQDKSNPVTLAKGGESYHQWGLAFDFVLRKFGFGKGTIAGKEYDFSTPIPYEILGFGKYFAARGLTWGGTWKVPVDPGHVELRIPHPVEKAKSGTAWWDEGKEVKAKVNKTFVYVLAGLVVLWGAKKLFGTLPGNWRLA